MPIYALFSNVWDFFTNGCAPGVCLKGFDERIVTQLKTLAVTLFCTGLLLCGGTVAFAQSSAPPAAGLTLNLETGSAPQGEVFRVGFLADSAPGHQRIVLRPFRDHLERSIERTVELVAYRDARALIQAMRRGRVDYAMAPGAVFAASYRACTCVVPLASQPNRDGSDGLFSAVLASRTGSIDALDDLDRARIAVVGQGSVVAHHVGLAELWRAEVALDDERLQFVASLHEGQALLARGDVDALLAWTRQAEGKVVFDAAPLNTLPQEARDTLSFVWRSRPIPTYTHFVHSDVSAQLQNTLRALLVGLTGRSGDAFEAVDSGSGRAFLARTVDDYAPYLDAYSYWDQSSR